MICKGIVGRGKGQGGEYPTANIPLADVGVSGIYAAQVEVDGDSYAAAAYAREGSGLLEAHLLDFSGDLYGKPIVVTLLVKVRNDETFASAEELARAIESDIAAVRVHFHDS